MKSKTTLQVVQSSVVIEGAGAELKRSFPVPALDHVDPFLLFEHFGSDDPRDYLAGVAKHRDSMGNSGDIHGGDVQRMTCTTARSCRLDPVSRQALSVLGGAVAYQNYRTSKYFVSGLCRLEKCPVEFPIRRCFCDGLIETSVAMDGQTHTMQADSSAELRQKNGTSFA